MPRWPESIRPTADDPLRGKRDGFTLVELLVSVVVLAILVAALSATFLQVSHVWQAGEARNDRTDNFRALEASITGELSAALLPISATDTASLQFVVNPPTVSSAYRNPDAIFWQAPIATEKTLGDVAVIGYFVKWNTSNPANPRARLCRVFIQGTQLTGGAPAADPRFLIYREPSNWISDLLLDAVAPADKASDYKGLFSENVVGLWARCLDEGDHIIQASGQPFDSRTGYTHTDSQGNTGTKPPCSLPSTVEISVAVLDSASANRIGPAERTEIEAAVKLAQTAGEFVDGALNNPVLQGVRPGFRSYAIRTYLYGAR